MNNLDRDLQRIGRDEVEANSRRKKAGNSFRPVQLPAGHSDEWPTMVIEAERRLHVNVRVQGFLRCAYKAQTCLHTENLQPLRW